MHAHAHTNAAMQSTWPAGITTTTAGELHDGSLGLSQPCHVLVLQPGGPLLPPGCRSCICPGNSCRNHADAALPRRSFGMQSGKGNANALNNLGLAYLEGIGCLRDETKAVSTVVTPFSTFVPVPLRALIA